MKKFLLSLIALSLILCACTNSKQVEIKNNSNNLLSNDDQNSNVDNTEDNQHLLNVDIDPEDILESTKNNTAFQYFVEDDEHIYEYALKDGTGFLLNDFDKEDLTYNPLCNKKDCMHNSSDCIAFFPNNEVVKGLLLVDDIIYVLLYDNVSYQLHLYAIDIDEYSETLIHTFDNIQLSQDANLMDFSNTVINGTIYVSSYQNSLMDNELKSVPEESLLVSYDLINDKEELLIDAHNYDDYFNHNIIGANNQGLYIKDTQYNDLNFYYLDLNTLKINKIFSYVDSSWLLGDVLFYVKEGVVYSTNLLDNKVHMMFEKDHDISYYCNEGYIFMRDSEFNIKYYDIRKNKYLFDGLDNADVFNVVFTLDSGYIVYDDTLSLYYYNVDNNQLDYMHSYETGNDG